MLLSSPEEKDLISHLASLTGLIILAANTYDPAKITHYAGELATKLTGRYIEIEMFTLNFREYLEMKEFYGKKIKDNKTEEFTDYIRFGGFPKVIEFDNPDDKDTYVSEVISQILDKDVIRHKKIRNRSVFDKVMTYVKLKYYKRYLMGLAESD